MRSVIRRPLSHDIERVPWEQLGPDFIEAWGRPGGKFDPEHLTVYGKSGSGKTYFVAEILRMRAAPPPVGKGSHVVAVATKKADRTLSGWGWPVINTWPPGYGENQVIYWARAKGLSAEHRIPQRAKVKALMDALWVPGSNIVVYWDELAYIEIDLRLKTELSTYYREGRANGITNVSSMQRPSGVTRLAHSEAGWTVSFSPKDQDDRKRVAEVFGDRAKYMQVLADLDKSKHEFLMRHDRSGLTFISHLPPPARRRQPKRREVSQPAGYGVPSRAERR